MRSWITECLEFRSAGSQDGSVHVQRSRIIGKVALVALDRPVVSGPVSPALVHWSGRHQLDEKQPDENADVEQRDAPQI